MSAHGKCKSGKVSYHSPAEAHLRYGKMNRDRKPLHVYKCDICPSWHLGTNERTEIALRDFKAKKARQSLLPLDPDEYLIDLDEGLE